jgi:hypothetical protein
MAKGESLDPEWWTPERETLANELSTKFSEELFIAGFDQYAATHVLGHSFAVAICETLGMEGERCRAAAAIIYEAMNKAAQRALRDEGFTRGRDE